MSAEDPPSPPAIPMEAAGVPSDARSSSSSHCSGVLAAGSMAPAETEAAAAAPGRCDVAAAAEASAAPAGDLDAQVKAIGKQLRALKELLKGEGVTGQQLNQHDEVKTLVLQLNDLKAKIAIKAVGDQLRVLRDDQCGGAAFNDEADALPWPVVKFKNNLFEASHAARPPKGYAVVLTTGGMNPLHRGHVQLLHQARWRLEAEGYGIVGMWLSPSHDTYLQRKAQALRTIGLSAPFRLELARRAVMSDQFVAIGNWGASPERSGWPDFPVVAKALQDALGEMKEGHVLRANRPGGEVQVFYACGTDVAQKCNLYKRSIQPKKSIGVVVVPRAGETPRAEMPKDLVFVASPAAGEVASYSSTKIRTAIAASDEGYLSNAMSPACAELLLRPSSPARRAFARDFDQLDRLRRRA
eukprot:NODE_6602_length_1656_cov_6.485939.p1 GENE.NODE_6602_length_1656_cov_6.485939~~NODE_6602_length_1656_cov_6.485939.p1  ORF type:complete len:439 (+),score=129.48 NODE_6602_length_1656_cov_6.485939:84-1319(+)